MHTRYLLREVLGNGEHGKVFTAIEEGTNIKYAIKISHVPFDKEIEILNLLKQFPHPNIVAIKEHFVDENTNINYLVLEYINGKILKNMILSRNQIRNVISQLLKIMEYLHSLGYINTDWSLENLILTEDNQLKLIDLGMVQKCNIISNGLMKGKTGYLAPEVFEKDEFGPSSDLWSIGIICFVLLTGVFPFEANNEKIFIKRIIHTKIDYSKYKLSRSERKFLKGLLKKNPLKRKIYREYLL